MAGQLRGEPLADRSPGPAGGGRLAGRHRGRFGQVALVVGAEPGQVRHQVLIDLVGLDVDQHAARGVGRGEVQALHFRGRDARGGQCGVDRGLDGRVDLRIGGRPHPAHPGLARGGRETRFHQAHAEFGRGHVGAERADRVQGGRQRVHAVDRHPAPGRLQAHDPAAGGRDPDRTAGVGAQRDVRLAGRDGDRRAAGGAAGQAPRISRVHRRPGPGVRAGRRPAQLAQVGLADQLGPGPAGRGHHGRVPIGRAGPLGDDRAADRGGHSRHVDAVLDGEPHAGTSGPQLHDPGRAAAGVIHTVMVALALGHGVSRRRRAGSAGTDHRRRTGHRSAT